MTEARIQNFLMQVNLPQTCGKKLLVKSLEGPVEFCVKLFHVSTLILPFLGCMYRGGPPIGQLVQLSFEDQMSLIATRVAALKISKIEWHFNNFASSNRTVVQTFIKLKHSSREFPGSRQITCANLEGKPRKGF